MAENKGSEMDRTPVMIKYCSKFFPAAVFIIMLLASCLFFQTFPLTDVFSALFPLCCSAWHGRISPAEPVF